MASHTKIITLMSLMKIQMIEPTFDHMGDCGLFRLLILNIIIKKEVMKTNIIIIN